MPWRADLRSASARIDQFLERHRAVYVSLLFLSPALSVTLAGVLLGEGLEDALLDGVVAGAAFVGFSTLFDRLR